MKIVPFASADDSRLDIFRQVKDRDLRSEEIMIVEGRHCVERCIAAGFDVVAVLCENDRHGEHAAPHVPVFSVGSDVMERVAGYGFHRGIMAAARRPAAISINFKAPVHYFLLTWPGFLHIIGIVSPGPILNKVLFP